MSRLFCGRLTSFLCVVAMNLGLSLPNKACGEEVWLSLDCMKRVGKSVAQRVGEPDKVHLLVTVSKSTVQDLEQKKFGPTEYHMPTNRDRRYGQYKLFTGNLGMGEYAVVQVEVLQKDEDIFTRLGLDDVLDGARKDVTKIIKDLTGNKVDGTVDALMNMNKKLQHLQPAAFNLLFGGTDRLGTFCISIVNDNGQLKLSVKDDGKGVTRDANPDTFRRVGGTMVTTPWAYHLKNGGGDYHAVIWIGPQYESPVRVLNSK